ncbi:MAG: ABC transporter permease [Spirochaetaceae bacterium]|nr:ABC transporter permease [Spirochaetaceae bacterium]
MTSEVPAPTAVEAAAEEAYFTASSWALMRRHLVKHRLAILGGSVLALLYLMGAIAPGFFSTYNVGQRNNDYILAPPQRIRVLHEGRPHRPFVYGLATTRDPETFRRIYAADKEAVYPIRFLVRGADYKLFGFVPTNIRLLGVAEPGVLFLFGTDELGRDMYSRTLHGARISLTIGLVGVAISFILGCLLGGISGYFGGAADMFIQRVIEFFSSIPTLPLWMALAAAVPTAWPPIRIYFMITVILSIVGWTGLARVVRGKMLQLREEDYVLSAKISNTGEMRIIGKHLLPGFMTYLIVHLTLAVPSMILGETALSFIGIGLRPPAVSWGVLLQQAQNIRSVALSPWLLTPALFVVATVLCFNFLGDGLRDAADPYK